MKEIVKTLFAPMLSVVFLMLGNGYFMTFLGLRLEIEGASNELIGLVASAFYAGILTGSLKSTQWIVRFGRLKVLVALCAWMAALILAMACWTEPYFWLAMRGLMGIGVGGLFVVIESWILLNSQASMRNQVFSIYLVLCYAMVSLGQFLIDIASPETFYPFLIAALFSIVAILPTVFVSFEVSSAAPTSAPRFTFLEAFRSCPQGFVGGAVAGMLLSSIYGLGPAYAHEMGLSVKETGTFMGIVIFGGLCLQWPLGKLADCSNRKGVLIIASLVTAIMSILIAMLNEASWPLLLTLSWIFGGFAFVIYPIGMAFTCEGLQDHQIVPATGGFIVSYGVGAILGPLIGSLCMSWLAGGLFYFIACICLFLCAVAFSPFIQFSKERSK